MGCNAWNHPADCNCRWSGGNGGVRVGPALSSHQKGEAREGSFSSRSAQAVSFTNPNARCPVCGDQVFFYKSASGGRVFFDDLGPPWPKHPCTDNPSLPIRLLGRIDSAGNSRGVRSPWAVDGWEPLTNVEWRRFFPDNGWPLLSGIRVISGRPIFLAFPYEWRVHVHAPIFVRTRASTNGFVEVSTAPDPDGIIAWETLPAKFDLFTMVRLARHLRHGPSLFALGKLLLQRKPLIENDLVLALSLLEEAASRNEWEACEQLGDIYDRGELVPRNAAKALTLLEKSLSFYPATLTWRVNNLRAKILRLKSTL